MINATRATPCPRHLPPSSRRVPRRTIIPWPCGAQGALHLRSDGVPSVGDVLLFVGGAMAGFNLLGALVIAVIGHSRPIPRRQDRVLAGLLDWVALGASRRCGRLGNRQDPRLGAGLLGPLTATVLYLLIASLQL